MENIVIIVTNIKGKDKDDDLLDNDLLLHIFESTCMELMLLHGEVKKNPGRLMVIDDTISLSSKVTFQNEEFLLKFSKGTYKENCTISIEIFYEKSGMANEKLNMPLYLFKIGIKDCLLKYFKEIYWETDTQNEGICKELYHKMHFIENNFRHLINKYMIAEIGYSWFKKVIHQEYIVKAQGFSQWYLQKKEYKAFKNVQPYLFNLQVTDLIKMLKNSYVGTVDKELVYELKKIANSYQGNINEILKEEYQQLLECQSIWEKEFIDIFGVDFENQWNEFGNMRNMIAHNKPICLELYNDIVAIINRLSGTFIRVERIYKGNLRSSEEKDVEYLYDKYSDDFYMVEAGIDSIPEDEREVLQEITDTEEYGELTSLFEEFESNIYWKIEDLRSVLYDIQSIRLKKIKVINLKSMLEVLCKIIYNYNEAKRNITLRYIDVTNHIKGLEVIFDEMIDNFDAALKHLDSVYNEIFYSEEFHLGTIAKMKNISGDVLEIVANGCICIDKGNTDTLLIDLVENGETILTGEIIKFYSDYEINDEGISIPINEDGLCINIEEIVEYIKKTFADLDDTLSKYIVDLQQFV
ncbi:hypothetical protein [Pelosinus propionicus]|uniref:Apea-like HEPN domain-containing protein n=1 Tax=Pelosinus propionicus DSM 13327 TaxID=1123291 RepID=A0A1I4JUB8_9FIRM|nr:hypothetical protein [Pelosinus propionicus]SFL70054.1 hypothetical protein SAMN04490355_101422 [Pelosinus propionicus DSM 13327]